MAHRSRPRSRAGHYFQGKQGRMFWNRMIEYDLLAPTTQYEDDSLVAHGYGLTDIVKIPHEYGNEPLAEEYAEGVDRILELIRVHKPRAVVFVYKRVLDKVLRHRFGVTGKGVVWLQPFARPILRDASVRIPASWYALQD